MTSTTTEALAADLALHRAIVLAALLAACVDHPRGAIPMLTAGGIAPKTFADTPDLAAIYECLVWASDARDGVPPRSKSDMGARCKWNLNDVNCWQDDTGPSRGSGSVWYAERLSAFLVYAPAFNRELIEAGLAELKKVDSAIATLAGKVAS